MHPIVSWNTSAIFQAFIYGLYLATLVHCLRWLVFSDEGWKFREDINRFMLSVTVLIFLFSTVSLAISVDNTLTGGDDTKHSSIIHFSMELATMTLTDAVLIYRCWIVYLNSRCVICLPFALWLANLVSIAFICYLLPYMDALDLRRRHASWEVFYSCNIAINVYATGAIVYRIIRVAKDSNNFSVHRYFKICRILLGSGILFALSSVVNLIALVLDTNPYEANLFRKFSNSINFSMAGVSFNLIIIQVGHERGSDTRIRLSMSQPSDTILHHIQSTGVNGSEPGQEIMGEELEYSSAVPNS